MCIVFKPFRDSIGAGLERRGIKTWDHLGASNTETGKQDTRQKRALLGEFAKSS